MSRASSLPQSPIVAREATTRRRPTWFRAVIVAALVLSFGAAVTGCGQRGPLYYPDKDNPDRRR